jgi:hypothetical protein
LTITPHLRKRPTTIQLLVPCDSTLGRRHGRSLSLGDAAALAWMHSSRREGPGRPLRTNRKSPTCRLEYARLRRRLRSSAPRLTTRPEVVRSRSASDRDSCACTRAKAGAWRPAFRADRVSRRAKAQLRGETNAGLTPRSGAARVAAISRGQKLAPSAKDGSTGPSSWNGKPGCPRRMRAR